MRERDSLCRLEGDTFAMLITDIDAAIQRVSGDVAAITLPTNLPPWSAYCLWPVNRDGPGRPLVLNQTEAWWLGCWPSCTPTSGLEASAS
mgnify:CR=1 FL=1